MKKTKRFIKQFLIFIVLLFLAISFLYPLFFLLINSFKTKNEYYVDPFGLPEALNFDNYKLLFANFKITTYFLNTWFIAAVSVVICLALAIFASYAFSKIEFKGSRLAYILIVSTMFIPGQVTMIPMYHMFAAMNLINTFTGVILSYIAGMLPGTILLLRSNFIGISTEMIEAARIDGAGYFAIIRNVIIPVGISAIAINIIFNFLMVSNDLFTPMILLQKTEKRTVIVALSGLINSRGGDPAYQMTGLFMTVFPPLIVYIIFNRFIVKGVAAGSVK